MDVERCQITGETLPNILLFGNAGCGKTTLAKIVANQVDAVLLEITGSSISSQLDLVKLMNTVANEHAHTGKQVIVFIDEVHGIIRGKGLNEDIWLPLLEENTLHHSCAGVSWTEPAKYPTACGETGEIIMPGETITWTQNNSTVKYEGVTWIGATTDPGMLNDAMRRRFPISVALEPYTSANITKIVQSYIDREQINIEPEAVEILADRARGVPALAIHHNLRQAVTCAVVRAKGTEEMKITKEDAIKACDVIGVGPQGVMNNDIRVLEVLSKNPEGMGIKNLAATANLNVTLVDNMIMPFLQQKEWVKTTHKRFITEEGIRFLERRSK